MPICCQVLPLKQLDFSVSRWKKIPELFLKWTGGSWREEESYMIVWLLARLIIFAAYPTHHNQHQRDYGHSLNFTGRTNKVPPSKKTEDPLECLFVAWIEVTEKAGSELHTVPRPNWFTSLLDNQNSYQVATRPCLKKAVPLAELLTAHELIFMQQ